MGFNYALCGFLSVELFVDTMKRDEAAQLEAFCEYVLHVGLDDELRYGRWTDFARKYNGPARVRNSRRLTFATRQFDIDSRLGKMPIRPPNTTLKGRKRSKLYYPSPF